MISVYFCAESFAYIVLKCFPEGEKKIIFDEETGEHLTVEQFTIDEMEKELLSDWLFEEI